jgi:hypothetical protein
MSRSYTERLQGLVRLHPFAAHSRVGSPGVGQKDPLLCMEP